MFTLTPIRAFMALLPVICLLALSPAYAVDTKPPAKPAVKTVTKTTVTKTVVAKTAAKAPAKPAPKKPDAKKAEAKKVEPAKVESKDPADNVNAGPQLPVPRFVTLGTDEVNVRKGPGTRFPISIVIKRDGLPVEITKEFDVWRQIRDIDGDGGWVHKQMLSGRRAVVVKGHTTALHEDADETSRPVVKLEPGVIASLHTCKGSWCNVKAQTYSGWIKKSDIWGVYPDEMFKE